MNLNAKKIGFFIGALGGAAYGTYLDITRRCNGATNCAEEFQASLSTDRSYIMSYAADTTEDFVCDGDDDDSVSCQMAQGISAIAGMYHLINMLSYYPSGMTMAFAGGVIGLAIGDVIDRGLSNNRPTA